MPRDHQQVVVVPIYRANDDEARGRVTAAVDTLYAELRAAGVRVKVDDRPGMSPGWKFNEHELRGVPVRVLGPIEGTSAEQWVTTNPAAYQELAQRYLAGFDRP